MKEAPVERPIHITQQFRSGRAMVYDFGGKTGRLTLRIAASENAGDEGAWRIEAATSNAPEAVVVVAWGATRAEALRQVGSSWTERRATDNLPAFDWDVITHAMTEVRAL